ncbi:tRNA U-34 5-methylaminomethyl-2-thiouridine biosynthesis protein, partial [Duganella callida]
MNTRVVLDTDFGRGERFAAARAQGGRLHYIGLAPVLPPAPDGLQDLWPLDVPGFHRVILDQDATLDLLVGAPDAVLPQIRAHVDEFHLGPLAPSHARLLAGLAVQGAALHARAADEALVWALTAAGFACRLAPGVSVDVATAGVRPAGAVTAETASAPPDIDAVYRGRMG